MNARRRNATGKARPNHAKQNKFFSFGRFRKSLPQTPSDCRKRQRPPAVYSDYSCRDCRIPGGNGVWLVGWKAGDAGQRRWSGHTGCWSGTQPERRTEAERLERICRDDTSAGGHGTATLEKSDASASEWLKYYESELAKPLFHEGGSMAPMERSLRGYRLQLERIRSLKRR